jgi:acetamidase/formamidase
VTTPTDTPSPGPIVWGPDPDGDPARLTYTFGGAAPVASLKPGAVLSTWTFDCFGGRVRSTSDLASEVCDPRMLNPQTGPFYIEGAEPGDTLAVHFVSIEPREDWGVSATVPFFGALTSTPTTATLQAALEERTWIYEIDAVGRQVHYSARDTSFTAALPLDPMHGTVGVAPALNEVRSSLAPGDWGGNMDTPEMRTGVTCYLGVNVEGAMFSFGDGHARQGEGETCGVAVECAMDTVVIVDLIKGVPTAWPRLENDHEIITTGSTKPLEDAFRISHQQMTHWVSELTGMSSLDSYQLVSQAVLSPVANVVDTVYTMTCKLPKKILGDVDVMQGMHARMRRRAAAFAAASGDRP